MVETVQVCQICHHKSYKYTCPKCNVPYCSLSCYKSPKHLKCSEEFYKSCILEDVTTSKSNEPADMQKIYDILKRMREIDAGIAPPNFDDAVDSDDDLNDLQDESREEVDDIAIRLQGININNPEKVWECLTSAEQQEFQGLIESGEIMKLLPDYKPWWLKRQNSKIIELPLKQNQNKEDVTIPPIKAKILNFSEICSQTPSPCLHYNLFNIIAAYTCVVRFYGGEHLLVSNSFEVAAQLINLSSTLKYGTNFDDTEDAICSVEMEALTTRNADIGVPTSLMIESREILKNDVHQIMVSQNYKLSALSDILELFILATKEIKHAKIGQAEFQNILAQCSGNIELNYKKLRQLAKKIDFFLAFVKSKE